MPGSVAVAASTADDLPRYSSMRGRLQQPSINSSERIPFFIPSESRGQQGMWPCRRPGTGPESRGPAPRPGWQLGPGISVHSILPKARVDRSMRERKLVLAGRQQGGREAGRRRFADLECLQGRPMPAPRLRNSRRGVHTSLLHTA